MNKLTYVIQVNDFNNETSTIVYEGSRLAIALIQFKQEYSKGSDVVLFIQDENDMTLDTLSNFDEITETMDIVFKDHDNVTLQSELRDTNNVKELYNNQLNEVKKENEQLKQQLNNYKSILSNKQNKEESKQPTQELFWYSYRLRGFSPFCQPKGHIKHDPTIGRYGIIAYDRQLTAYELDEYELIPYKGEVKAS